MRIMAVVALFTLPPTLGVASPLTGHALGSGSPPVVIRHKPGHHGGPPWARAWRARYGPNRITECRMREETHSTRGRYLRRQAPDAVGLTHDTELRPCRQSFPWKLDAENGRRCELT
jgi:hypothetical protein